MGLYWDIARTPITVLESLCISSAPLNIVESMRFHFSLFPAMHTLMIVGGITAIPTLRLLRPECRRLCSMLSQNVLCSSWMLIGMTFGATLFVQTIKSMNGMSVENFQRDLATIGYRIDVTGVFNDQTAAVVRAFQRRWRPERITGEGDTVTITLAHTVAELASK